MTGQMISYSLAKLISSTVLEIFSLSNMRVLCVPTVDL